MTKLLAKLHDFEVLKDGPYYTAKFPVYGGDYYICHTPDFDQALAELNRFILEANVAREELEALA